MNALRRLFCLPHHWLSYPLTNPSCRLLGNGSVSTAIITTRPLPYPRQRPRLLHASTIRPQESLRLVLITPRLLFDD